MAKKDSNTKDRLARLREKLAQTDVGGKAQGFWAPEDGENVIRILDGVGDMEYFFQEVGKHWLPGKQNQSVYCPSFTSAGELECPLCEVVKQMYGMGAKDEAGNLNVRKSYWMNVIVRGRESEGPLIYTPGVTIFQQLIAIINDPDYGDIFDDEEGVDITIIRQGKGLDTEYNVIPKRHSTPLHKDSGTIDKWYEVAKDLSYVELTDDPEEDAELKKGHAVWVLPYERIASEYNVDALLGYDDEDDEVEDEVAEEVVHPAKRAVSERRARRK